MPESGLTAKNLTATASKAPSVAPRSNHVTFHGTLSRSSHKRSPGNPGAPARANPAKKGDPLPGRLSKKPVESKTRSILRQTQPKRRSRVGTHAGPLSVTGQFNRPAKGYVALKRYQTAPTGAPGTSVHVKGAGVQGSNLNHTGNRPQVTTKEPVAVQQSTRLVSKVSVQGKTKVLKPGLTPSQSVSRKVGLTGMAKASLALRKAPVTSAPELKGGLRRLNGSASLKVKAKLISRALVHSPTKSVPKGRVKTQPTSAAKSQPEGPSWGVAGPAVPRGSAKGGMTTPLAVQSRSVETSGTGPQGWTIAPAQIRNAGGIQESTWTIRPPLFMGPPMKMELIQEGSRLQANLTVHENLMGLVNTSPTALPQNAVHLPEGVSTLQFTLASHGGPSHGGELSQGFRQSQEGGHTPQAYGTADRSVAMAPRGADGGSLTMLDYRA